MVTPPLLPHYVDLLLNGPARYTQQHDMGPGKTLAIVLGALAVEFGVVWLLLRLIWFITIRLRSIMSWVLQRFNVRKPEADYTILQLIIPSNTDKSAYATEQLHILLRSIANPHGFWQRMAGWKLTYSLELVATKDDGIRYMIRILSSEADHVRRMLLSYLPGLKIKAVEDYLSTLDGEHVNVTELRLTNDFVIPLESNKALEEHDPIAYLSGHMRKLSMGEVIALQIVTTPVITNTHPLEIRRMSDMRHRIALNKTLSDKLTTYNIDVGRILTRTLFAPFWIIGGLFTIVIGAITAILSNDIPESWNGDADKRPADNPYEKTLRDKMMSKLNQHQYEVTIRLLVASPDASVTYERLNSLVASFETLTSTGQSIRRRKHIPVIAPRSKYYSRFVSRELTRHIFSQPTIVSASEMADLYHFPNTDLTKTEDLVRSRSRDLPVPLSQKHSKTKLDVIVGQNHFDGDMQDIGLTLKQRQKHTYIIGKTGTGKSTMLMGSICQDMVNGKGVAVLDPHGDMFRELLRIVPEHRREDVVVFDPSDREYPVGLNILDPGIPFANEDDKQEWITSSVISVFAKLADEAQWGPRMEHILRNTTLTALQTEKPSLYTLQRLLTDKKYQKEVAKTLNDPVLKQFWDKEFKLMGTMQMSNATAPLTHRLGHFITAKMSRHILLQETSTLRITDIMDEGKILIANLSKGDIGEDQNFFFGTILTSIIWMAAYQRTKIPERDRKDFFVYVDEFQNFATPQFGAIVSEGRKFHVGLILSHQSIAQIKDKDLLKVIAGNAATIICLKAGPEDEAFILPHMRPEVEKGDIVNLAPYHFYMKVSGDESEDAFSGTTVQLKVDGSHKTRDEVVENSRKQYASEKREVEENLEVLLSSTVPRTKSTPKKKASSTSAKKVLHGI